MDEQAYPLCINFENNSDMSVPLRCNYVCYYYNKSIEKQVVRELECWQLAVMNYRQKSGSNENVMEVGQFIVHSPKTPHLFCIPHNETIGYFTIHFTGSYASQLVESCGLKPDIIYSLSDDAGLDTVRQIFREIFQEAASKEPGYQNMITAKLVTILAFLGRNINTGKSEREDKISKRLEKTRLFIHGNFSDSSLSVADLAVRARLSESRYRELFRKVNGISPSEYILQLRITHACDLLRNTDHTISKIATYCGYQDLSYFSRLFRKKTGMTPTQYREDNTR